MTINQLKEEIVALLKQGADPNTPVVIPTMDDLGTVFTHAREATLTLVVQRNDGTFAEPLPGVPNACVLIME
jgi:hypothetical protein